MRFIPFAIACIAFAPAIASAAPFLKLVSAGGSATSSTVGLGTPTLTLDLALDTGGLDVSGVQFHLTTTAAAATYAAAPVTTLGAPFVASDIGLSPAAGAAVDATSETSFFKSAGLDYAAVDGAAIARFSFDTSNVTAGTYTFAPVFSLFSNATVGLEQPADFGPAGVFAFAVAVGQTPEPTTLVATTAVLCGLACRGRRRALR